ncbi:unnamed protein product [Coccothraustes coccothraustes]
MRSPAHCRAHLCRGDAWPAGVGRRDLPRCTASSRRQQRLGELLRGGRHPPQRCRAEPAGAHGPSPRSHPPQSQGWRSPPCPHNLPPLTSRFRGQHSPVRLPEAAQTSLTARLRSPHPGQVPSAAALFLLLLPVEPLPLSPETSGALPAQLPPLSSVHLPVAHSCPRPLPSRRRHTRPGSEWAPRARRPAPLGKRTRPGSPRTGRIPPPCRSPLPAAKPVSPAIPLPSPPQH